MENARMNTIRYIHCWNVPKLHFYKLKIKIQPDMLSLPMKSIGIGQKNSIPTRNTPQIITIQLSPSEGIATFGELEFDKGNVTVSVTTTKMNMDKTQTHVTISIVD